MPMTLSRLLQDRPEVVTATPHEPLATVLERMLDHDFSQLPVVQEAAGVRRLVGMVSFHGVARAGLYLNVAASTLRVEHALDPELHSAQPGDELWQVLERTREARAVAIVNDARELQGILTDFDFTQFLRQNSQDYLLTANIETAVRQLIQQAFQDRPESELAEAVRQQEVGSQKRLKGPFHKAVRHCVSAAGMPDGSINASDIEKAFAEHLLAPASGDFEMLTFAQYNAIFVDRVSWDWHKERLGLERKTVIRLLDEARELRNRLAHHRAGLTALERDRLQYLRSMLDRVLDAAAGGEDVPDEIDERAIASAHTDEAASDPEEGMAAFGAYLSELGTDESRVKYTFKQVETVIGHQLPASASQNRSWWSNDGESAQSLGWLDAGWRVVSVNLTEKRVTMGRNSARQETYLQAFAMLFRALEQADAWSGSTPSPAGRSWQDIAYLPASGTSTARVVLSFCRGRRFRVELYIDRGDKAQNKQVFDLIRARRDSLHEKLGDAQLSWERLDNRQASRVALYYPDRIHASDDEEAITELSQWVAENAPSFVAAMAAVYPAELPESAVSGEE